MSRIVQNVNHLLLDYCHPCEWVYSFARLRVCCVSQGDSVQTCRGDRTWSGTRPVCLGRLALIFSTTESGKKVLTRPRQEQNSAPPKKTRAGQ